MKECSKSIPRRLANSNFINYFFVGKGLDIGGKPDPLCLYTSLFCQMESVRTWDWEDGDAQYLQSLDDNLFDFVHSSHCLEHMVDPFEALANWFRVLKPGGHLIITIPDEDLYEQGVFPSTFNLDHKWTYTIFKNESWSPKSVNVIELVKSLGKQADVIKLEQLISTYRFELPRYDQTTSPVGESGIEFIVRKRQPYELENKGRWRSDNEQPEREIRIHLNQHRDDIKTLKQANTELPPFTNDKDL